MILFQAPRTWIYIRTNLNLTHFCIFWQQLILKNFTHWRSGFIHLFICHCITMPGQIYNRWSILPWSGTLPGQVDSTCDKEEYSCLLVTFPPPCFNCTVSENKHLAELLHVCSLLLGWCQPDNMPLHENVPYCPVAVIAFF